MGPMPKFPPGFLAGRAAQALGQMGPSPEAIAALVDVISPEELERVKAYRRRCAEKNQQLQALPTPGKIGLGLGRRYFPVGGSIFGSQSPCKPLGEIGPPAVAAIPALISAYNNGWSLFQGAIPVALGRIAPNSPAAPDAVAVLIRALDEKDHSNRLGAARGTRQLRHGCGGGGPQAPGPPGGFQQFDP